MIRSARALPAWALAIGLPRALHDRIAVCGLDRWLGGVHLGSDRPSWRWDGSRQAIIRLH
ncbi:MAG: hypothetical protein DMF89_02400 [Acidobacteria bacterium]|nr:MAG: hypothetical protein DMF90_29295 [Acidobacteriota bacterium]PYR52586.1 MAG: hypothetical protein DMF89_02400 [Acidobacteriota bacterium]